MKKLESSETVKVDDLGVLLSPGTPVWISDAQARDSRCLSTLIRLGKVHVSDSMRSKAFRDTRERTSRRPAALPAVGSFSVEVPLPSLSHVPQSAVSSPAPKIDVEQIAKTAARVTVSEVMQRIDIEGRVENAVKKAMASAVFVSPSGSSLLQTQVKSSQAFSGPEEPIFIPTGIVKSDTAEISVQSSASDSGGLDDAAKALKALKKKKS